MFSNHTFDITKTDQTKSKLKNNYEKRIFSFMSLQVLECNQITQAINILQGLIPKEDDKKLDPDHLKKLFVFSVMWSVGAILELDDRKKVKYFL